MRFAMARIRDGYDAWPVSDQAQTPDQALAELRERYQQLDEDFSVATVIEISLSPTSELVCRKLAELLDELDPKDANVTDIFNLLVGGAFTAGVSLGIQIEQS